MRHFIVYFRDKRAPKDVPAADHYVVQGECYVFYNLSGYGFESIPVYLVADIVEVEA